MKTLAILSLLLPTLLHAAAFEKIGGANSVDGEVVATTTLATYDGSAHFVPLVATFVLVSGVAVSTVPHVSIGTNAPNYDNVVPNTILTGFDANDPYPTVQVPASKKSTLLGYAGEPLKMRLYDAGSGSLLLFNVAVFGTPEF